MPSTAVLSTYNIDSGKAFIRPIGNGLIHKTWYVNTADGHEYILQKVNTSVFKRPDDIADNMRLMGDYLNSNEPDYLFIRLKNDRVYTMADGEVYRMYPFVKDSTTIDTPENTKQVFEAARQFGLFTKKLSGLDAGSLHITLPDFHDLTLRYAQFETALKTGDKNRLDNASAEIEQLKEHAGIVTQFEKIIKDPEFHLRVTHHDTKINNVLFDKLNNGICIIDLDTVMPGYFISDVGDMMRTYLSPLNEESTDFDHIKIEDEYLKAITEGYLSEMKDELTEKEKSVFYFSGRFMMYMQALRFLTDYLNKDVYYGAKYPGHNLNRAKNQLVLLERYDEKIAAKEAPIYS